jgi:antitoxin (DNA-binding transcriptional repressor) of toxin-antitoxin stability system
MKSTLLSLRRSPGKILQAIERRQEVTLTKRGKALARIVPLQDDACKKVSGQPAFGMWRDLDETSVDTQVREFRKGRHHDL